MDPMYVVALTSGYERFEPGEHVGTVIFESKSLADAAMVAGATLATHPDEVIHLFEKKG